MRFRRQTRMVGVVIAAAALVVAGCADKKGAATPSAYPTSSAYAPSSSSEVPTSVQSPADLGLGILPVGRINLEGRRFDAPAPEHPANPAGDGTAQCRRLTVAVAGDLSTVEGAGIANGAQLAVDQHNAKNPGCQLVLVRVDSRGNTVTALNQAKRLVSTPDVIAVIGPTTSSDAAAVGPLYNEAGLVSLSPSATAATLTDKGWKTFFRGINNDDVEGESLARHLTGTLMRKRVCVISDNGESAAGLARAVTQGLGSAAVESCSSITPTGTVDIPARVADITKAGADGVFFAGSPRDAGPLAAALKKSAPQVVFAAGDQANSADFVALAGDAAPAAVLSCLCSPDPKSFTTEFTEKFTDAPTRFALESYDLATIVITGIDARRQTRVQMREYVSRYEGNGLSRHYKWAPTGELLDNTVWLYPIGPA